MKRLLKQLPLILLLTLPLFAAAYAFAEDLRIEHAADISAQLTLLFIVLAAVAMGIYLHRCMKKQPYSYKNASMVGGMIYLIYLIATVFVPVCLLNNDKYKGDLFMYHLMGNVLESVKYFDIGLIPVVALLFISLTASNIALMRHEGKNPRNMLGAFLGAFLLVLSVGNMLLWKHLLEERWVESGGRAFGQVMLRLVPVLTSGLCCYLECLFTGMCICAVAAARRKLAYDQDFMIILGCAIRKDGSLYPLLRGRVDHAEAFARRQHDESGKDLVFVPSGGQGSDECISEAEAMRRYLTDLGISDERILSEDRSSDTRENMRFSKELIEKQGKQDAKIAFSTTNYHVFRAGVYAAEEGLNACGTGSKTKWYFWPNAFVREFFALLHARKWVVLMNVVCIFVFCTAIALVDWHIVL